MKRILSAVVGTLLLAAITFGLQTKKASATSLAYTLSVTSNCAVVVSGSATATASVSSGETSNVTVSNNDLVVSISASGPGVPSGTVLQPNNKASTHNTETFQLGSVASQETIIFTAIPNSTDPYGEGNNCPTGSTPTAGKLIINPVAPSSSTSTTTKPKTTTAPSITTNTSAQTVSDTVTVSSVQVGDKTVATDKSFDVNQNDTINITGQTMANGLVTLTIHSDPKTATVTADANGKWAYSITRLDTGSHYIEATVTNPTTKKVSASVKLLSFNVAFAPNATIGANSDPAEPVKKNSPIIILVPIMLLAAAATFIFWRRKKSKLDSTTNIQTEPKDKSSDSEDNPTIKA